jgi:hypothetical protein
MLRILRPELPKGCAVIPPDPRKSREGRFQRSFGSVTVFRRFGEWEFAVPAMRGYEVRASAHPVAASGATHSNSGS